VERKKDKKQTGSKKEHLSQEGEGEKISATKEIRKQRKMKLLRLEKGKAGSYEPTYRLEGLAERKVSVHIDSGRGSSPRKERKSNAAETRKPVGRKP